MSRVSLESVSADAAETARLVRLVLGGDSAAFEGIIARHETRVMTTAIRLLGSRNEAQDAAQDVFMRAFKYLHRLDLTKPIEPWLMRITVNVCRDIGRRRQHHQTLFVEADYPDTADESANPHADLAEEQQRRILQNALNGLPEKERLAIVLRDIEGLSTAEVAEVLQSSETTVRSQVSRGRLRIRQTIDRLTEGGK